MSRQHDPVERDPPESRDPPPDVRPVTFDALIVSIRSRVERAAWDLARRVGAFILQNARNSVIGLWEALRTASLLFILFPFPYFAWASLGEALIRHGTLFGTAFGSTVIVAPLVGASILAYRYWKPAERSPPIPVALRLVPEVKIVGGSAAAIGSSDSFAVEAWKSLKSLFGVIDPRRMEMGVLFYLVVVLGGAMAISATMAFAPIGVELSQTFLAQPNLWLMTALSASIVFLQHCLAFVIAFVGSILSA